MLSILQLDNFSETGVKFDRKYYMNKQRKKNILKIFKSINILNQ